MIYVHDSTISLLLRSCGAWERERQREREGEGGSVGNCWVGQRISHATCISVTSIPAPSPPGGKEKKIRSHLTPWKKQFITVSFLKPRRSTSRVFSQNTVHRRHRSCTINKLQGQPPLFIFINKSEIFYLLLYRALAVEGLKLPVPPV